VKRLLSYFSFQGRTNRQRYWLTGLAIFGLVFVSALVATMATRIPILGILVALLLFAVILGAVVAGLANSARRLHDRGKSAWWLLVFQGVPGLLSALRVLVSAGGGADAAGPAALLALIGLPFWIWAFVELGCLRGTTGPNRFGDDPLGEPVQEVFA
jgi:uncharacterized membrane protein YhaH (DUF805 family)